jgi:lipoate-protein ligase B
VLRIRTLGTVPYHEAFALQHALARHTDDDYLLVLQHPHVFTLGPHADRAHVLTDPASVGATLEETDRGGDVTYHGPGQLVVYPILSVADEPSAGPAHVHRLEQLIIATLGDLGLPGATCDNDYPGVWIDAQGESPRKIASACVPSGERRARGARCTVLRSTLSATSPCSVTSSRVGSPTGA